MNGTDHIEELILGLKNIIQTLENAKYDKLTLDSLDSRVKELKEMEKLKEQNGLKNLYFFKDSMYSSNYVCLTKEETLLLKDDVSHLLLESSDLTQLLQSGYMSIRFPQTGKTYDNLGDLKHDYLTLKLSGV